jgi:hypothetical protein
MTAVAAVLVAVLFLTTGGTPLLYSGSGEISWDGGALTPSRLRWNGVKRSLERVRAMRDRLETRALLDESLRRTAVDPVVFRRSGNRLVVDAALTSELQSLWMALPARRPEVRTAIVLELERPEAIYLDRAIDSTGLCVLRRFGKDAAKKLSREIGWEGGECLFAESFGLPDLGTRGWMRGLRSGLSWEHNGGPRWLRWGSSGEASTPPAWFARDRSDVWDTWGGWRYRPVGRAEMACRVGRADQCEVATGLGPDGWPTAGVPWGYDNRMLPVSGLPQDLLAALGPEKFGEIWSASDPIATSYAHVTGDRIDTWLMSWAERYAPRIEQDNGLALLGWVGALLWLSLLGLLTFERLKHRTVT